MTTIFTSNYDGSSGGKYDLLCEATEETYSIVDNTSRVTAYLYLRRNDGYANSAYNNVGTAWSITIDGETFSGTSTWDTRNTSDWQILAAATKVVTHESNGRKTITISASHTGNSASGSSKMGNASGSGTFELTKIPRASSISATDANIGSTSSIYITRADESFTHTITYSFGSLTETIVTKTTLINVPFDIPTTFYAQIPNSKTGIVTLTCITYSGDTEVGTATKTFVVTASESECKPDLEATLIDVNSTTTALTGDNSKLIKSKSTARITPVAAAKNSATISKIIVNNTEINGSYIDFINAVSETFKIDVVDSRGYTNSITLSPTIIQYLSLTLTAEFYRTAATSSEIKVKYEGKYFNESFGNVENTLNVAWAYRIKGDSEWNTGGSLNPNISENNYSEEISLGTEYDYQEAYEFILYASDKLTNLNVQQPLKKGEPIYDYGVDADGENYLNVNGGIYKNNVNILNLIYPIGAIYISATSTNPSTLFGGTWTQIEDTFLLAAGSLYAAGSTGGKAKVGLSVENLPSHTHTGKTNVDGAHVHDSTAYGWINDDVYATRRAELSVNNNSGFGADIRIRSNNSEHQHWYTTDATGGGTEHENMPPYLAVYVWERTA